MWYLRQGVPKEEIDGLPMRGFSLSGHENITKLKNWAIAAEDAWRFGIYFGQTGRPRGLRDPAEVGAVQTGVGPVPSHHLSTQTSNRTRAAAKVPSSLRRAGGKVCGALDGNHGCQTVTLSHCGARKHLQARLENYCSWIWK